MIKHENENVPSHKPKTVSEKNDGTNFASEPFAFAMHVFISFTTSRQYILIRKRNSLLQP